MRKKGWKYPISSHHRWKVYGDVDRSLLQYFKGAHDRVRDGKASRIEWERNREGYEAFCKELGPKPENMKKATVGRIDHSKGYVTGNIQWEEHYWNSIKRKGTRYERHAY